MSEGIRLGMLSGLEPSRNRGISSGIQAGLKQVFPFVPNELRSQRFVIRIPNEDRVDASSQTTTVSEESPPYGVLRRSVKMENSSPTAPACSSPNDRNASVELLGDENNGQAASNETVPLGTDVVNLSSYGTITPENQQLTDLTEVGKTHSKGVDC